MIRGVGEVERLAAEAWPAAVVEELDGWRLRFNWGMTRRANSVWPNESGNRIPLLEKLEQVEAFYARWGAPARYQICPAALPVDLDAVLADRGYTIDARTCVQVAPLGRVLARCGSHSHGSVMVGEQFEDRWFEVYREAEQVPEEKAELRRGILQRIGLRTGYALCEMEGEAAAIGLGVLGGGWLGIFSMATRSVYRRRGAANGVMNALARWGEAGGARRAYLQVMEGNGAALALYGRAGFETLYHYRYREAPPGTG